MLDQLRDQFFSSISQSRWCILCTGGPSGFGVIPAWKSSQEFELVCLLPRWADALYHIEQDPHVIVVFLDIQVNELRWLEYRGTARRVQRADWSGYGPSDKPWIRPDERYEAIAISPERIDLIDESKGWGMRETLDF